MKVHKFVEVSAGVLSLAVLLSAFSSAKAAEENVTIPKSRLQELERKEAELGRLKTAPVPSRDEGPPPKSEGDLSKTRATTPTQPTPPAPASPPMASLPPLKGGELVEAADLAAHYLADPSVADQRYRKRIFKVRGEIERFVILPFIHEYKIVLKTADRQVMVICDVVPPENFKAVFTAKNGSQLVGLTADERRLPIARVGGLAVVGGRCNGFGDGILKMAGCKLVSVR
jgi:hypothetical protein